MNVDILQAAIDVVRPEPDMSPADFAAAHRMLKEGSTWSPGPWDRTVFPYLDPIMDLGQEAIETGRKLALMKSGQGGGSEGMENLTHWFQIYTPGPTLYLISKDDLAREFGRERFAYANETILPLKRKHLAGKTQGETLQIKRYTDHKLVLAGGRSVLNLQSTPYRIVVIDEADSLLDEIANQGDPIKLAEIRTDAYSEGGTTCVVAFAHPSTRDRGVGKIYYQESDQRRCHIACPSCEQWIPMLWKYVTAKDVKDPTSYSYACHLCGHVLTDGERFAGMRRSRQISMLPPEIAKRKPWIGAHFSQLCSKPMVFLAREWISTQDEPSGRRVFVNKRLGDVFDDAEREISPGDWVKLFEERKLGELPEGAEFLTSGQDSGLRELHWCVWAWGRVDGQLRGWLLDLGAEAGPAVYDEDRRSLEERDLFTFDEILYARTWGVRKMRVVLGLHDSGWNPIAVYEYCRNRQASRAFPSKGLGLDDRARTAPLAWHPVSSYQIGDLKVDPRGQLKRADMNTFALKADFLALAETKRLALPRETPTAFLDHLSSERMINDKGRKKWVARGANHWFDCTIMAYAAAINVDQLLNRKKPAEEERDTSTAWRTGARAGGWQS